MPYLTVASELSGKIAFLAPVEELESIDINCVMQYGYMELRYIIEWARKVTGMARLHVSHCTKEWLKSGLGFFWRKCISYKTLEKNWIIAISSVASGKK